jgi:hypothetical protein
VLKPGGQFIFFEHGLAPDAGVRRWQVRTEPIFQWAFEGCHVTRDIPALIRNGGFKIEQMETGYLAPFPKTGSHCFWGIARPESEGAVHARTNPGPTQVFSTAQIVFRTS